ncbi:MAG: hypothetical protein U0Y68_24410 [Blastocatellia bacterium]
MPFGNYAVADASVRESWLKAAIHDYFFVKSLRLLRPGGVIAFITSRYTLDKQSPKVRQYLATHAKLLAAARLPRDAFRANAGTEVITDVLILQKRRQPCRVGNEYWMETSDTRFKAQFGSLHKNLKHLNPHSPAIPFLKALEIPVGRNLFNRAPLFYQRTIRPARQSQAQCTPKEALLILSE